MNFLADNGSPFAYILGWEKGLAENPELPVFVGSFEDFKEVSVLLMLTKLSLFFKKVRHNTNDKKLWNSK